MGRKKSSEINWLLAHLGIQFAVFTIMLTTWIGFVPALTFALANAAVHGVIDWYIWRLYKLSVMKRLESKFPEGEMDWGSNRIQAGKTWQYWEDHWFYSTIGLDQMLHTITIISLFSVLI